MKTITSPIAYEHRKSYIIPRIGDVVVGYRYGKAPEGGYSYNHRDNGSESGVSMASVGYLPDVASFACSIARDERKKYYYRGVVADFGADGEFVLKDVEQITYNEYRRERTSNKDYYNKLSADYIQERLHCFFDKFDLHLDDDAAQAHFDRFGTSVCSLNDDELRARENERYRQKREQAKVDYQNYLNEMTAMLIRK
jgi:hypothetical protein